MTTDQQQADHPPLPKGAEAARSRYVQVPAGSVVIVLAPTQWAAVDQAMDEAIGRPGPLRQVRAIEQAAAKVRDARDQLGPPPPA